MPACWRGRICVLAVAPGALALFLRVAGAGAVFGAPEAISPDAVPASEPQIAAVSLVQFAFRPRI